ncbi:MAG: choice-of-anchor B family protein [Bacteroidetes bacterium]|nr:choice-of-anchor B family protein [Bacteroidota bacterium]
MKIKIQTGIFSFLFSLSIFSSAQMQLNMSLLSNWTNTSYPTNWTGGRFSDCWGYVDSLGREYAVIGSTVGSHIFDVTNPTTPVLVSFQVGMESSGNVVHRDYKTYQHYMYAVCDEGNSSLQIFDLQYLPDSVVKVYDSHSICKTAHNIFIDNGRIYFAGLRDNGGNPITLRVASLSNPEIPVVINDLSTPLFSYVHDVCVRKDTAFLSAGNDGFFIYDYKNPTSPSLIQSITSYPEQGYNHSSWVSADGKTVVFADETHGMGLKVYDISNINNPTLKSIFRSNLLNVSDSMGPNGSIPHNPFILGTKVFISYYHDGVQCFDISNTSSPFQAGYYDTHPGDIDYTGYGPGCWGVYPYLPSRHIIGSDIANGLFVLDGTQLLGVNEENSFSSDVIIFPNPNTGKFNLKMNQFEDLKMNSIEIYNVYGEKIYRADNFQINQSSNFQIDISSFCAGIYLMKVSDNKTSLTKKIIKTN